MRKHGVFAFFFLFSLSGLGGTNSSGGGHSIKTEFQRRAQDLISRISGVPAANDLCPADLMREGLKAEIRVVDQLIDPSTGRPPSEPNLEAWTSPGLIQLLKAPWEQKLKPPVDPLLQSSLDALIVHEVYRATRALLGADQPAELCEDDRYQISSKIPALLEGNVADSQIYRLYFFEAATRHSAGGVFSLTNHDTGERYEFGGLNCDRPLDGESVRICAGVERAGGRLVLFYGRLAAPEFVESGVMFESLALAETERTVVANLMRLTTVTRPFHIAFDILDGSMAYGTDLRRLKPLSFRP